MLFIVLDGPLVDSDYLLIAANLKTRYAFFQSLLVIFSFGFGDSVEFG